MFLNIGNIVRIELINEPNDVQQFLRQEIGFHETNSLDEEPDIRIMFTNYIELGNKINFVGTTAAYQDETFYLIRGDKKLSIPVKAFEEARYDISCETGIRSSELYNLLVYFFIEEVLLKKDATFVHSSAVFSNNKGLLFPAWGNVGKTSISLSFLKEGAEFVSDDQAIITRNGTLLAYPLKLHLNKYQLQFLKKGWRFNPEYTTRSIRRAILLTAGTILEKIPVSFIKELGDGALRLGEATRPYVTAPFTTLFPHSKARKLTPLHIVFFLTRTANNEIEIEEAEKEFIEDKMFSSLLYELNVKIPELYQLLRYALPYEGERLMRERESKAKEIIKQALVGKKLYHVKLPSALDINQVFNKLIKYL